MQLILPFALVMSAVCSSLAGTVSRCDVVRALRNENVPDSEMRDWLCLVHHESNFRYDTVGTNSNGSKDYGVFQLNSNYQCDRPHGYSGTICWRLNTDGCEDTCSSFTDSDISNDAHCAVRVKNCNDFNKWYGWRDFCQGDLSVINAYNYADC